MRKCEELQMQNKELQKQMGDLHVHLGKIENGSLKINETVKAIIDYNPDILFTIDSPDFTLRVAEKVKNINNNIKKHFLNLAHMASNFNLPFLSMGMSNDFEVALKCGATHIRIGTKIFGERN